MLFYKLKAISGSARVDGFLEVKLYWDAPLKIS